jgi:Uma2 family endonuclease
MQDRLRAERDDRSVPGAPTDPDRFIEWASRQEERYELSRGRVTMLPFVSRPHVRVASNIVIELGKRLDIDAFDIGTGEFGVATPVSRRLPDVIVDRATGSPSYRLSTEPIFIAEVLSPDDEERDLLEKAGEYTMIPSLMTYIVCSQLEPKVHLWVRRRGHFPDEPRIVTGRKASFALGGLGIRLSMTAIYRGIPVQA